MSEAEGRDRFRRQDSIGNFRQLTVLLDKKLGEGHLVGKSVVVGTWLGFAAEMLEKLSDAIRNRGE